MTTAEKAAPVPNFDSYSPREIAERVRKAGITKANLNFWTMFTLAILAGSFIGLGAEFCTLVITGIDVGFGLTKLIGGMVFSLGLVLVVVAGAELFTGNNLLTISWISGSVPFSSVLRNWIVVFLGNLVGSVALAGFMFMTHQWTAANYSVGATAIRIAADKVTLPFMTALVRGILCNILVCLAVWLCFSARSVADKILAIVFPITAFVASGFEHSIANMYFIPYGMLLSTQPDVVAAAGLSAVQLSTLTLWGFLGNLIPVTIGNLIGGGIMVGVMYWFVYLREERKEEALIEEPEPAVAYEPLVALEGRAMTTTTAAAIPALGGVALLNYTIASADMFYSEANQRVVSLSGNLEGGFHLCCEIPGGGAVPTADLSQMLLEYAMTCAALGDLPGAYRQIDAFGRRLGEALAVQIIRDTPAEVASRRAACALECILEALSVPFTIEQVGRELRYKLDLCPLCEAAEHTGLGHVELGHHGLNALCRGLISALDPELGIRLPSGAHADHVFSVLTPLSTDELVSI